MASLKDQIEQARANLLREIEAFQARHGIPDSTFGRLAMGDPAFLYELRGQSERAPASKPRKPSPETIDALREFMRAYPKLQRAGNDVAAA